MSWTGRRSPSLDPTPTNPIALRFTTKDKSANVIYLARPCQYSKFINSNAPYPQKYLTSHRFAPEIIKSMHTVLDGIKNQYNFTGFNLVGFSGGATIAALLTAQRDDILSLRTVAGNLDHELLHNIHNVSQLSGSLNAITVAHKISDIPQHHFIGENDKVIIPAITQSFIKSSNNTRCIHSTIIPCATHKKGWIEMVNATESPDKLSGATP